MTPLLTAAELAQVLAVPVSTIYRLSEEGKILTLKVGSLSRFQLDQVLASLAGGDDD